MTAGFAAIARPGSIARGTATKPGPTAVTVRLARAPARFERTVEPERQLDPGPLVGEVRRDAVAEVLAALPVAGATGQAAGGDDVTGAFLVPLGLTGGDGATGLALDPTGAGAGALGRAKFMGVEAVGRRFLIIADCSGSMDGPKIARLRAELAQTVKSLKPGAKFYVIFYDDSAYPYPEARWLAGARDVANLLQWINQVPGGGGTNPLPAFELAFSRLRPRPDAIFFMTDGLFSPQVATALPQLNSGRRPVPIHAISFVDRTSEAMMRQIATDSKGTYRHVDLTP